MKNLSITILFVSLCVVNCGLNAQEPRLGLTNDIVSKNKEEITHYPMWKLGAQIGAGSLAIIFTVLGAIQHGSTECTKTLGENHSCVSATVENGFFGAILGGVAGTAVGHGLSKNYAIIQKF